MLRNNPVETKTWTARCTIDERRHISAISQYGSHCDRGAAKSAIMFIKLAGLKRGRCICMYIFEWGRYSEVERRVYVCGGEEKEK